MEKLGIIEGASGRIIMTISDRCNYITKIRRELKMTNAHAYKTIIKLEKEGLITREKIHTKTIIKITEKGLEVKYHLFKIMELLENE